MVYSQSAKVCLLGLTLVLLAVPTIGDDFLAYQLGIYLLYGVAAQGVALVWGRLGFLPLGQALFFGLAAYATGGVLMRAGGNPWFYALLPCVIAAPAALAYGVARLVFSGQHESSPNFSLITLALSMLGAQLAHHFTGLTGGFNGLSNIPEIFGLDRYGSLYYLIALLVVGSTALLSWLYQTPLGALWQAISQNENRVQFFGYASDRHKALAFALSAALAACAGTLYATQQGLVTPSTIGFQLSAELLIWTAVGGRFGPYGALLGAVGIGLLSEQLRQVWQHWEVLVAMLFIAVVLYFPGGMAQIFSQLLRRNGAAKQATSDATASHAARIPVAPVNRPLPSGQAVRLQLENLVVRRQGVTILNGLHLNIDKPGVHCLIGPNGAGKTSSFNALTGRLALSEGEIFLDNRRVTGQNAVMLARHGVGRKFQIPSVFSTLSVRENLAIALWSNRANFLDLLSAKPWRWQSEMLSFLQQRFVFLVAQAEQSAGQLSQGQRQMLELAMTLVAEPRLLLLDEPCAGLSTVETQQQIDVITQGVTTLGSTALVIEHDMAAVLRLSGSVHVLHQGRLLASGSLADIQANAAVQAVYSGGQK